MTFEMQIDEIFRLSNGRTMFAGMISGHAGLIAPRVRAAGRSTHSPGNTLRGRARREEARSLQPAALHRDQGRSRLVLRRGPFRQMETDLRQFISYGLKGTRRPARIP